MNRRFAATRPMLIGSLFGKGIESIHNNEEDAGIIRHFGALKDNEQHVLEGAVDVELVTRMVNFYTSAGPEYPYKGTPEYEFRVPLPDFDEVPILGYFDLRDNDYPIVREFKTGRSATHPVWGWSQQRVNTSQQAALYWWADKYLNGRDSVVKFTIIGYANDRISMIELDTKPDMRRVIEFQDKVKALWGAIEAESFPCTCGRCISP